MKLWSDAWAEFVPFLSFDIEIRKVICSTNAIESVNARIRKARPCPRTLPQRSRSPQVHLYGTDEPGPDREGRKRWTMCWKAPLNAFQIAFEGRLTPSNI